MKYVDTWDLESIFPGGTKSAELQKKIETIQAEIKVYQDSLHAWNFQKDSSPETFKMILSKQETIYVII